MAGFQGMDPVVMRNIAQRLQTQAAQLEGVITSVQHTVDEAAATWSGHDAQAFNQWWTSQHRPALQAAGQSMVDAVAAIERNVQEQERISGLSGGAHGGGTGGGFDPIQALKILTQLGYPLGYAKDFLSQYLLPRGADGRWISPKNLDKLTRQLATMDDRNLIPRGGGWSTLADIARPLSALGGGLSALDLYQGLQQSDGGRITTGGVGLTTVIPRMPLPLAAAGGAALAYGELTLPTSNEEYAGSYDMALRNRFGNAYDPDNPTQEQAAYGMQRYEGFGGFFNSISDGMDYKRDKAYAGIGNAWNGATGWLTGR